MTYRSASRKTEPPTEDRARKSAPPRPGVFSTKYPFYSAPRRKAEYGDERVCFCISLRAYLPNYTSSQYQIFFPAYVTFCRGSVLLWRRCDILCTSGFMTDDITGHTEARRLMTLQRVTSLHRRAQENASAASYWLRRVQDSERRDCDVRRDLRARGTGAKLAMHYCLPVATACTGTCLWTPHFVCYLRRHCHT